MAQWRNSELVAIILVRLSHQQFSVEIIGNLDHSNPLGITDDDEGIFPTSTDAYTYIYINIYIYIHT